MIAYRNLNLIGTSHISIESIKEVVRAVTELKPAVVALELDENRLFAIMGEKKGKLSLRDVGALGIKGFLFNLMGAWAEKKLGRLVGTSPGDEMRAAVKTAREQNARIALIDRDIRQTIKSLFRQITWKEKFRFLWDITAGLFSKRRRIEFDLRKVPEKEFISKIIKQVRKRYPSVYNALIHERNVIMAQHLYSLMERYKDMPVVAVVGAGHEEGIISWLRASHSAPHTRSE
ncbi:MAG TPA: hypothetical protein HA362_01510 [Nanoarchaeota archaeon]|nr:hypothetical protein [Nanoarchaeota archaeon]